MKKINDIQNQLLNPMNYQIKLQQQRSPLKKEKRRTKTKKSFYKKANKGDVRDVDKFLVLFQNTFMGKKYTVKQQVKKRQTKTILLNFMELTN